MALGTVGLYFLHVWVAVGYLIYSFGFYLWLTPVKHCKYCYYQVKETSIDSKTRKPIGKLLSLDEWKESYFPKHVACGKKWGVTFFILWVLPMVLIGISFFWSFSIYALIALLGYIGVLAIMLIQRLIALLGYIGVLAVMLMESLSNMRYRG